MRRLRRDKYLKKLIKRSKRGYLGEPIATISYYGPTDQIASKVSVGIVYNDERGVQALERWYDEENDIRRVPAVNEAIVQFIDQHKARSVVRVTEINGCPHEEGIDYPQGESCPNCDFWAGKTRLTDRIQQLVDEQTSLEEE